MIQIIEILTVRLEIYIPRDHLILVFEVLYHVVLLLCLSCRIDPLPPGCASVLQSGVSHT